MASVLFVDDNATLCRAMTLLLRMQGYQSDSASSVEEALSRLQQEEYDIVISDLCMPGRSGIDLVKMMRANPRSNLARLPVVILSAVNDQQQIQRARAAGANDYVVKAGSNFADLPKRLGRYLKAISQPLNEEDASPTPDSR
jgi:CheY-like chemotaxis protein